MLNFSISKNSHYSKIFKFLPPFSFTTKNFISFEGKFNENCLHDFNTVDEWDINKFYGFSTSYYHHIQSARLGWRCLDGKTIQLVTYCYDNSQRIEEIILDNILPNEVFKCTISVEPNYFVFNYIKGDNLKHIKIKKTGNSSKFKYILFPYFGGNMSAPQDMNMYIKRA